MLFLIVTISQKSKVKNQKPETRNQKPETRNQKPETRNQKPETRNQKPETRKSGNQRSKKFSNEPSGRKIFNVQEQAGEGVPSSFTYGEKAECFMLSFL
jgi:hypothetical protein